MLFSQNTNWFSLHFHSLRRFEVGFSFKMRRNNTSDLVLHTSWAGSGPGSGPGMPHLALYWKSCTSCLQVKSFISYWPQGQGAWRKPSCTRIHCSWRVRATHTMFSYLVRHLGAITFTVFSNFWGNRLGSSAEWVVNQTGFFVWAGAMGGNNRRDKVYSQHCESPSYPLVWEG